jgi:hypothetical protein
MSKSHDFFTLFAATTWELCSPILITTRPIHLQKTLYKPAINSSGFLPYIAAQNMPGQMQRKHRSLDYPFLEADLHNSLVNPIPFSPNREASAIFAYS